VNDVADVGASALQWHQEDLVVVFLAGLPPRPRTGHAIVGKTCEVFRKGFSSVQIANALFVDRPIRQQDGDPQLMHSSTFVARSEDPVLGVRVNLARIG